jgi:hypothetical protein
MWNKSFHIISQMKRDFGRASLLRLSPPPSYSLVLYSSPSFLFFLFKSKWISVEFCPSLVGKKECWYTWHKGLAVVWIGYKTQRHGIGILVLGLVMTFLWPYSMKIVEGRGALHRQLTIVSLIGHLCKSTISFYEPAIYLNRLLKWRIPWYHRFVW